MRISFYRNLKEIERIKQYLSFRTTLVYLQKKIVLSCLLINTKLYVFHNRAVDIKDLKFYIFLSK